MSAYSVRRSYEGVSMGAILGLNRDNIGDVWGLYSLIPLAVNGVDDNVEPVHGLYRGYTWAM